MNEVNTPASLPEKPLHNSEPKSKNNRLKETLSTIGIIILAPIVALFLTAFVFQSYQVDGPSMETTLQNRDRLIVTKTGKTWSKITGKPYIPQRYDIVIFNHTGEFGGELASQKQLIKRVVGLPGDRVVVKDGIVTVFNGQNPNGYLIDREGPENEVIRDTPGNIDETIKAEEIYVMGDNRENSLDSRAFGAVRSQDVVGKLSWRIFPFNKTDKF